MTEKPTAQAIVAQDNLDNIPITFIRPTKGWIPINLRELWEFRDLLYFFVWRDIKVRYKQTLLGFTWSIIQPLLAMAIFTLFFGIFAKMPSDGIPYPIFAYVALLPWTLFSESLTRSTNSMISNANIIQKVYFPRVALPISSILSPLLDFGIAFIILILMMVYYHVIPTINLVWLPAFIILAMLTSLGIGLWMSALNVLYRDFRYVVPFVIQIWMFASPVVYSASIIPEQYRVLYGLNPMTGVIEGFRWALLGTNAPGLIIIISIVISILILISGTFFFKRMEKMFADEV